MGSLSAGRAGNAMAAAALATLKWGANQYSEESSIEDSARLFCISYTSVERARIVRASDDGGRQRADGEVVRPA